MAPMSVRSKECDEANRNLRSCLENLTAQMANRLGCTQAHEIILIFEERDEAIRDFRSHLESFRGETLNRLDGAPARNVVFEERDETIQPPRSCPENLSAQTGSHPAHKPVFIFEKR